MRIIEIELFTVDERATLSRVHELILKIEGRIWSAFMTSLFLVVVFGVTVLFLDVYYFGHTKFSFLGLRGHSPSAIRNAFLYLSALSFLCGILTPIIFHLIFKPLNRLDEIKLRELSQEEGIEKAFWKLYKIQGLLEALPESWIRSSHMKPYDQFIKRYFSHKLPQSN